MGYYWRKADREKKVTQKQIALLHVARNELKMAEADYRSVLSLYGGTESAKELSQEGFRNVLAYLERMGFSNKSRRFHQPSNTPDSSEGLPYPAQIKKMQDLFAALGIDAAERQQGFCRRMIRTPWPQTKTEASKVIEGLKAMLARQEKSV